jgi:hypothetical protein
MKTEELGFSTAQMRMLKKIHHDINRNITKAKKLLSKKHPLSGNMHKILPEAERETVVIHHMKADPNDRHFAIENLTAAVKGRPDRVCPPGTYARLMVKVDGKWQVMMTDAPYELHSSRPLMDHAHGNVLIAGLGIGASLIPVLRKKEVKDVIVVEKSQDVMDLVLPHIRSVLTRGQNEKFRVFNDDAFEWKHHPQGPLFDVIWLDIWHSVASSNLPEITKLKRRFGKWLNRKNPRHWMGAWEEKYLREEEAEYRETQRFIYSAVGGELKPNKTAKKVVTEGKELRL